jgi:hypothetical protein
MIQRKETPKITEIRGIMLKKKSCRHTPSIMPKDNTVIFRKPKSITVYFLAASRALRISAGIQTPPCYILTYYILYLFLCIEYENSGNKSIYPSSKK